MLPASTDHLRRASRTDAWAATRNDILENDAANRLFPQYYARAEGAYVWDTDGHRYLDFILGYGPVVLGHADHRVNGAVGDRIARGVCVSPLWSPLQYELTELLSAIIPGAESCFLLRTGSDATSAAIRLARIFTGRDRVLRWGYNGWHDWTAPRPDGVPGAVAALTEQFAYGDLASVEAAFARHPGEIACVIMMPYGLDPPSGAYLEAVRQIAHRHGALFVLDEMRSGFRIALGGAQDFFGLTADLATFSKAMANGWPISAVTGRRDVLSCLARTHMSSTYCANAAEMAAAIRTIEILRTDGFYPRLWALSDRLFDGLGRAVRRSGAPVALRGLPVSPFLDFGADGAGASGDRERAKRAFYAQTLAEGVLLHPNHQWYVCASHTADDIDYAVDVCAAALDRAFG